MVVDDRKTLTQRRKEETYENILEAAYGVFARRGYDAATIDEIAEVCGVSKGALYHHFASKEILFSTLIRNRYQEPVRLVLTGDGSGEVLDLEATVRASVEAAWQQALSDEVCQKLLTEARTQAGRNPVVREILEDVHNRSEGAVVGVLEQGKRAGVVRADLDTVTACAVLAGMVDGTIAHYLAHEMDGGDVGYDPARVIDETVTAMVRYLEPCG